MDNEILIANILKYCAEENTKPTVACAESGAGKDLIANLRKGQTPSVAKVADLAAYLGCTTSDLVGDNKTPQQAKNEREELFSRLMSMLDEKQIEELGKKMEEMGK